mgnify:CR=1 FL=1
MNISLCKCLVLSLFMFSCISIYAQTQNFIYWGPRKYTYTQLECAVMDHDMNLFFVKQGIEGKDLIEVRDYVSKYLKAFNDGKIKRNVDGSYDVYVSELITENKPVKRNIFGKIKGDKKRLALSYFNYLFSIMKPID